MTTAPETEQPPLKLRRMCSKDGVGHTVNAKTLPRFAAATAAAPAPAAAPAAATAAAAAAASLETAGTRGNACGGALRPCTMAVKCGSPHCSFMAQQNIGTWGKKDCKFELQRACHRHYMQEHVDVPNEPASKMFVSDMAWDLVHTFAVVYDPVDDTAPTLKKQHHCVC